jgi:DNA-binding MarR family transcriptional regulator
MTEADRIIAAVCEASGVNHNGLMSTRRSAQYWAPRQLAYFLLHERTRMSLPQIGAKMGGRDHTTILWGLRRWEEQAHKPERAELQLRTLEVLARPTPVQVPGVRLSPVSIREAKRRVKQIRFTNATYMVLAALHRLGHHAITDQLADDLAWGEERVNDHLRKLVAAGWVRIEETKGRGGRAYFTALRDHNGVLIQLKHDARPEQRNKRAKRPCNRCGNSFQPTEARRFRCHKCDRTINEGGEYNAAPGMEMMA